MARRGHFDNHWGFVVDAVDVEAEELSEPTSKAVDVGKVADRPIREERPAPRNLALDVGAQFPSVEANSAFCVELEAISVEVVPQPCDLLDGLLEVDPHVTGHRQEKADVQRYGRNCGRGLGDSGAVDARACDAAEVLEILVKGPCRCLQVLLRHPYGPRPVDR